jgi:large conductance mechanosensitive channel
MIKEFKEFAARGSMLDMAVGIILGAAFATIIRSLVADIIMPPIGLLLGDVDFANLFIVLKQGAVAGPYASLAVAQEAGAVTMNYGVFINAILIFIIVAFCLFLIIRQMNKMKKEEPAAEPTTKECPFCFTAIPIAAKRCPNCTSELS